ncbi:MAP kinase [Aureobasidium pullulans]|uniref:mitogen-activated protein kinase kinase n=1 Tax=Aureobasidium pullulans TaxID=5580 RepID=A0A4V4KP13_AURPU|nr:MAP kinase [Aureobasidium pullulans]THZ36271.1 MAP kinase [Aureobasidium pullulans]THZ52256.1 MAP kinase [Aureobasidium pullulans]
MRRWPTNHDVEASNPEIVSQHRESGVADQRVFCNQCETGLGSSIAGPGRRLSFEGLRTSTLAGTSGELLRHKLLRHDTEELDDLTWQIAWEEKKITCFGNVGQGNSGTVQKCVLEGCGSVFAVKVSILYSLRYRTGGLLTKQQTLIADSGVIPRKGILQEWKISKRCSSPFICRYYGFFVNESQGTSHISMEYCEGGSLYQLTSRARGQGRRIEENILRKIADSVLRGLTYLESRNIIHCDLKPGNILFTRRGQIKLCDFGASVEGNAEGEAKLFTGSFCYMSPERVQGLTYTIRSDVWSLGISLLETAHNQHPFSTEKSGSNTRYSAFDLITLITSHSPPRLFSGDVTVGDQDIFWSTTAQDFIDCCLEKSSATRPGPMELLKHPWFVPIENSEVDLINFLRIVWDWPDCQT